MHWYLIKTIQIIIMSETTKKTVLGVVYDPMIGKILKRILNKIGYHTDIIESEADASEEVRKRAEQALPDILITDWTQVNGKEVIQTVKEVIGKILKETGEEKKVDKYVINGGLIEAIELEKLGAKNIPKPFSREELINALRGNVPIMEENEENTNF